MYSQLSESYRAIDNFRTALLGLIPLASAGGILFLFQQEITPTQQSFLLPIGLFGFAITLGLLLFEVYGIKKCGALIQAGRTLEGQMNASGQFTCRPHSVAWLINEPFASGVIYPAVLAAWAYLATHFRWPALAFWVAVAVFAAGFGGMLVYNIRLREQGPDPEC
jgi:hypothetical protein